MTSRTSTFAGAVSGAFAAAHDRLAAGLRGCLEGATGPESATRVRGFLAEVRRHMRIEEQTLFATFENRSGLVNAGPTLLLRREHREIETRLEAIAEAMERGQGCDVRPAVLALVALLEDHRRREEAALFPMCERLLDGGARSTVLRELGRSTDRD